MLFVLRSQSDSESSVIKYSRNMSLNIVDDLADFSLETITFENRTKDVFWKGTGPCIVVLSEIPGITPEVAEFARRIAAHGFTVAMPNLFGTPGKPFSNGYALKSMTRACISKEFLVLARGRSSPVTNWIRKLVGVAVTRCGGEGVGVVGMCFTGGFALALAVDPLVKAPVMSQPSLPLPLGKKRKENLGLSKEELLIVKERVHKEQLCVFGLRFTQDPLVPETRFRKLKDELGKGFIGIEIDSSSSNPHGIQKSAHSVLTTEFRETPEHPTFIAHQEIINHFKQQLFEP